MNFGRAATPLLGHVIRTQASINTFIQILLAVMLLRILSSE
jgi:hypothetical protein